MAKGRWGPRHCWPALGSLGVLLWLGVFASVSQADSPANYGTSSNHIRASRSLVGVDAIASAPCPTWGIVPSANASAEESTLSSVSAVSADDVWAVGHTVSGGVGRTLTEHWDGTSWTIVPSPNATSGYNYLWGVFGSSSNDVWAVGFACGGNCLVNAPGSVAQSLILHWNGTSWSIVPSPNISLNTYPWAVSALSANDAWAVGEYNACWGCTTSSLAMHWNGSAWSIVVGPNSGGSSNSPRAVAAVSANDVWMAGYYHDGSRFRTLIDHWNGSTWTMVPSPNSGTSDNFLSGMTTIASNDAWAVGYCCKGSANQTLTLHWDGSTWSIVPSPDVGSGDNILAGVAALSTSDVWAVGHYNNGSVVQTLTEHWNGSAWSVVASPNVGSSYNRVAAVSTLPSTGEAWAVGYDQNGTSPYQTLIERYSDPCAPTAPTATNTPMLAAPTPSVPPTLPPTPLPGSGTRTFPETGKTVNGLFLDYWNNHGGLAQQGFPISQVFGEVSDLNGKPYTVQYFERAVFEYHPENQAPFNVLLSQLGTFQYKKKYPGGAPGQQANSTPGSVLFRETGKRLGGRFLQYWRQNGGLPQQGYPISDEFTEVSDLNGKPYRVQYFERAVFELHPENQPPYDVLLSQLGTFQYKKKYGGR